MKAISGGQTNIDSFHPIILFDGECNLCNGFANLLFRVDRKDKFRFIPLQSASEQEFLKDFPLSNSNSVFLIQEGRIDNMSNAILRIFKILGGFWSLLYLFILVPKPFRNGVYRFISRYRYHVFGKQPSCVVAVSAISKYLA